MKSKNWDFGQDDEELLDASTKFLGTKTFIPLRLLIKVPIGDP